MLAQQVAKKYSMALFSLAAEKGILDTAWEQFGSLGEYLRTDNTFLDFMSAPQIPDRQKEDLVKKAFSGKLESCFFDFLMVLIRKRRVGFLPDIIDELDRLIRAEKGIARATRITAGPITDDERQRLVEKLTQKSSLKIELEEKIDKSILGGMIVILHNQIIDGSVRYALDQLRNRLMKVKVH
ncbi:MAG TPA: ATP synthase F1 subunit delta [candidate division Zixibacteria bacterium]|nr:ATP synthase F1 subunit delta [candidate division Zixibacteria bacterium]